MIDYTEIVIRLGAATLIGSAIGLNRDLHDKPTGVRTLGLVGLGSALAVMASVDLSPVEASDWNAVSRAIQGVITGIGFLGAGVIIRNTEGTHIQGLTTAACTWLTACIGIVCGVGAWRAVVVAVPIVALLLTFGGPLEDMLHRRWRRPKGD